MSTKRNVLPVDPKPEHYDLTIKPNFDDFTFDGRVIIKMLAEKPCTSITFNATELTFKTVKLSNGETFTKDDMTFDDHNERATLTLKNGEIGPGNFTIDAEYTGLMNDKMKGFYRSKYTVDGKEAWMGTTQFEAVDARRALPCWDEPVHKATFDVTLIAKDGLDILSNMPEKSRSVTDGIATVSFQTTPKMSTYLLAWNIAKFDVIQRTIKKKRSGEETLVRVFAAEGKIKQGEFALDVACRCLPMYEEFFGCDYVLPKADLLAIPDFAAGAMENWGLVTYRETALLCDDSSAQAHRERVAMVVAHELAHMWFGNLVTMDWWKELWLNESFATWVQYWATDCLFPEWGIWNRFVSQDMMRAFSLDALKTSHAVEVQEIENAHEVDEIFDAISYCKGCSVMRMVVEYLGIDAFQKGCVKYFEKFAYCNAVTNDLWEYLGQAAGKDLTAINNCWILKQGFPILRVARGSADPDNTITITQGRYLATTSTPSAEDDETIWDVPLKVCDTNGANETRLMLQQKESTHPWTTSNGVKLNCGQFAFTRVYYAAELLPQLQQAISEKKISNLDRLGVVSDYAAFATSGHATADEALEISKSYSNEDDSNVWTAVDGLIGEIKAMCRAAPESTRAKFEEFIHKLYVPALERIGAQPKDGENAQVKQMRATLLGRLAGSNHTSSIEACHAMWDGRETTPIPADLRGIVYAVHVRTKGADGVVAMKKHYDESSDAMERARAVTALGACRDIKMLENDILPYIMSEKVRSGEALYFVAPISSNPVAEELYVKMFTQSWRAMFDKFPGMLLSRFVGAIGNLSSQESLDALKAFWPTVDQKERESMDRSFQQGAEGIAINIAFCERNVTKVAEYLMK